MDATRDDDVIPALDELLPALDAAYQAMGRVRLNEDPARSDTLRQHQDLLLRLASHLPELIADKARLDWLERKGSSLICECGDGDFDRNAWRADNPRPGNYRATVREAIDAAMPAAHLSGERNG